jgi:S-formylglutathione hydrolase FrmB
MRSVTVFCAILILLNLAPPAFAQLKAPPGYREKMRGLYQAPREAVWVNEPKPASLPPNTIHSTYFSQSMGHDVGYCIYLPPQYGNETERRFPVIYHLHGLNGDELNRVNNARVLHEGILAGKWPPLIMVFPNGGRATYYKDSIDGKFMSETTVIKELIPHIDKTYRTIADRNGRCIEGHSMGGRGSTRLALKYPEMFCSLFNQAGNVIHLAELYDPTAPERFPNNLLGPDKARYLENDPFELLQKNIDQIRGKLRIMILCGTQDRTHLPSVREFHQALLELGIDHTYFEAEGMEHNQDKLIERFKPIWFDYHVESLRLAAAKAGDAKSK